MKVTFFFGAGAERDYVNCVGKDFIEPLLKDRYKKEREGLRPGSGRLSLLHPNSKKIFIQTICENETEAIDIFGGKVIDLCKEYRNNELNKKKAISLSNKCREWYKNVTENKGKSQIRDFFLERGVFFDSLDEKFNDLRFAEPHKKGERAISAYYNVFILMLNNLYDTSNLSWDIKSVIELLKTDYTNQKEDDTKDSYYESLGKLDSKDYCIATTNYTRWIEKETGYEHVRHLNGQMTWFEDLKTLHVYDVLNEAVEQTEHIIPFIMIPSGVKPIVSRKQIEEFSGFINDLESSDLLCVVGYRFNPEDNHVNSILADWLRVDKRKLVYFNHNGDLKWEKLQWVEQFTRAKCELSEVFGRDVKIVDIHTEDGKSNDLFKDWVDMLKERYWETVGTVLSVPDLRAAETAAPTEFGESPPPCQLR